MEVKKIKQKFTISRMLFAVVIFFWVGAFFGNVLESQCLSRLADYAYILFLFAIPIFVAEFLVGERKRLKK